MAFLDPNFTALALHCTNVGSFRRLPVKERSHGQGTALAKCLEAFGYTPPTTFLHKFISTIQPSNNQAKRHHGRSAEHDSEWANIRTFRIDAGQSGFHTGAHKISHLFVVFEYSTVADTPAASEMVLRWTPTSLASAPPSQCSVPLSACTLRTSSEFSTAHFEKVASAR